MAEELQVRHDGSHFSQRLFSVANHPLEQLVTQLPSLSNFGVLQDEHWFDDGPSHFSQTLAQVLHCFVDSSAYSLSLHLLTHTLKRMNNLLIANI